MIVRAKYAGTNTYSSNTATVRVTVHRNLYAPEFIGANNINVKVNRNAGAGTFIINMNATDRDTKVREWFCFIYSISVFWEIVFTLLKNMTLIYNYCLYEKYNVVNNSMEWKLNNTSD